MTYFNLAVLCLFWPFARAIYHHIQPSNAAGKKLRACNIWREPNNFSRTQLCQMHVRGSLGRVAREMAWMRWGEWGGSLKRREEAAAQSSSANTCVCMSFSMAAARSNHRAAEVISKYTYNCDGPIIRKMRVVITR